MDINNITAGTYLLVAHSWEEYLSKPGQPFDFRRHKRGAIVDLNVEDARRLVAAKAVIPYDPANPTHVVNADGSISEIPKPDPAATGLVLTEDQLASLDLPSDATSEDVVLALQATKELLDELAAAQAAAAAAEQRAAAAEAVRQAEPELATRPESDRIEDILAWVAGDPVKAATALEGEKSTKGDQPRPRLVSALEEIITSPGGGS